MRSRTRVGSSVDFGLPLMTDCCAVEVMNKLQVSISVSDQGIALVLVNIGKLEAGL